MHFPLYYLLRFAGRPLLYCIARVHLIHASAVPKGPYLLACNHISHFDPAILMLLYPKPIDFMSMRELFKRRLSRFFFTSCGAFPVDRGRVDSQAVREAIRRLEQKRIVGIFPEGGIRTGENSILAGAKAGLGAVALAHLAEVKIRVCVVVGGDQFYNWKNFFRRPHLYFIYGPELQLDASLIPKEARIKLLEQMQDTFCKLYQEFLRTVKPLAHALPQSYEERTSKKK